MSTPRIRLFLLAATLILCGGASLLHAQVDFKGAPPNPEVRPRATRPRPQTARRTGRATTAQAAGSQSQTPVDVSDQVEDAIQNGNAKFDATDNVLNGAGDSEQKINQMSPLLTQAEQSYKQASSLNPKEPRAFYGLGNVYYREALIGAFKVLKGIGDFATMDQKMNGAIHSYQQAIQLKSNYAEAYYGLGVAYDANRQKAEAMEQYQILQKLNPQRAELLLNEINKQ